MKTPDRLETLVDEALPVHPCAAAGRAQEIRRALLEDAGPDARQHVVPRAPFEDDAFDAGPVQEKREQKPGRPASHDHDLRALGGLWRSLVHVSP